MASLYNISNDILNVFADIEVNEGEVTEEQISALAIKQEELRDKLDSYVKAVKEFQSNADFCKKEKQAINNRQNVYKNRVERLKQAMLDAVVQFGNEGKTNKFIDLPTCKIFTKQSTSIQVDEERVRILIEHLNKFIYELVTTGAFYGGEDVDLQGIIDSINANVIAEQGEDFKPYTFNDLIYLDVEVITRSNIYDLFRYGKEVLVGFAVNYLKSSIESKINTDVIKEGINITTEKNLPEITIAKKVINQSIQIR